MVLCSSEHLGWSAPFAPLNKNAVQSIESERRWKDLATTYSRGTYRATTIGKTVFDGRVRDGIGSGHSFMVTKKLLIHHRGTEDTERNETELSVNSVPLWLN